MIDRLFASRLTTTRRVSSEVSAMVVERVGAAIASLVCRRVLRPTRPTMTATSTTAGRWATHPSSPCSGDDCMKFLKARFMILLLSLLNAAYCSWSWSWLLILARENVLRRLGGSYVMNHQSDRKEMKLMRRS